MNDGQATVLVLLLILVGLEALLHPTIRNFFKSLKPATGK